MILVLDIGTSSVRAAVYDARGERMPDSFVKNERQIELTEEGGAEIDAEKAFAQVVEAIDDVIKQAPEAAASVEYVAASCFWHSLVGVDKDGVAITPVLTWADTRAREKVAVLREKFDEQTVHNRTGARFHPSFWTAKLLWYGNERKTIFACVDRWLSFSDYLALRLSGTPITSVSMASGTGIFNTRTCEWDTELIEYLAVGEENLPDIAKDDSETFQTDHWPELKNAKWFPAIADGAANNIGAGCVTKDKAALMIGTSGAMRAAYAGDPPAEIPAGLWCYRIDRKRVIIGGALSDGGGLYAWLKHTLAITEIDDEIEGEISLRKPDSHGLTFLPFLQGERSTGYHEYATGGVLGLTQNTAAVEIVHAALESVAYRFAEIFEQLQQVCPIEEITASGGALRESPVWTQIICDVFGHDLDLPETREASSQGAVLWALENIGIGNIETLPMPKGEKFKLNKENHEIYKQARARHESFYKKLMD
jgi:gluconokinase